MIKPLSITHVLNKLPLASTQFLCPTEFHILDMLIRLAYTEGNASIPIDTLHNGSRRYNTATLVFSDNLLHRSTIAKHRQALIDKDLISYRLKSVHKTVRSYGTYTLNKPNICTILSCMYDQAVADGLFNKLLDSTRYVCQRDRSTMRATVQDTIIFNRNISVDNILSVTDTYIYNITTSLCMLTGSHRFVGYPSKLNDLLKNVSRKQIYRSLDTLGVHSLINIDYNDKDKRVHELDIPYDIREQHTRNSRILRLQSTINQ